MRLAGSLESSETGGAALAPKPKSGYERAFGRSMFGELTGSPLLKRIVVHAETCTLVSCFGNQRGCIAPCVFVSRAVVRHFLSPLCFGSRYVSWKRWSTVFTRGAN